MGRQISSYDSNEKRLASWQAFLVLKVTYFTYQVAGQLSWGDDFLFDRTLGFQFTDYRQGLFSEK